MHWSPVSDCSCFTCLSLKGNVNLSWEITIQRLHRFCILIWCLFLEQTMGAASRSRKHPEHLIQQSGGAVLFSENDARQVSNATKKNNNNNKSHNVRHHRQPIKHFHHFPSQPIMKRGNCKQRDPGFVSRVDSVLKLDLKCHTLHLQHREQRHTCE